MPLVQHYRAMARNNAWSNWRLLSACCLLADGDFTAPRTSFFPSLAATLNHLLAVDRYYLDALEGAGRGRKLLDQRQPLTHAADLLLAQQGVDRRLAGFCDGLAAADLTRLVALDRGPRGTAYESVGNVLPHLFVHQIHHRGQAHAMLAGTAVAPPQLDEFFLDEDQPVTGPERAMLGLA